MAPTPLEIDSPIERFSPDQLAELGNRLISVHPQAAQTSPLSEDMLRTLAAGGSTGPDLLAVLTRLATWIKEHRADLYAAYPGPTPPFDHMLGFSLLVERV
jgi:hypothetical protein